MKVISILIYHRDTEEIDVVFPLGHGFLETVRKASREGEHVLKRALTEDRDEFTVSYANQVFHCAQHPKDYNIYYLLVTDKVIDVALRYGCFALIRNFTRITPFPIAELLETLKDTLGQTEKKTKTKEEFEMTAEAIQAELEKTIATLKEDVDKLITRGESMEKLLTQTADLATDAIQFKTRAFRTRRASRPTDFFACLPEEKIRKLDTSQPMPKLQRIK